MSRVVATLVLTASLSASAFGATQIFTTTMSGPAESPPVASPGTGSATMVYDDVARTLSISASWSGLIGTTTVAHIHGATALPFTSTAGVAVTPGTLPGFPTGLTAGSYSTLLDLSLTSTYTSAFLTANGGTTLGAELGLISAMQTGRAYFNIHSTFATGGEIRGFIPTPGALAVLGLGGLAMARRRR